eukprot:gene1978-3845_t
MHLQLYILLTFSCAFNFWLTYAYKPIVSLAKSKRAKGMYRTVSELLPNLVQSRGYVSRGLSSTSLSAMRVTQMTSSSFPQFLQVDILSWWKETTGDLSSSQSSKSVQTDMFSSYNHVAGFMDYDPKMAAFTSRNLHKKKGRTSKWFDL